MGVESEVIFEVRCTYFEFQVKKVSKKYFFQLFVKMARCAFFFILYQKLQLIFIIDPFIMNFRRVKNVLWKKNSALWGGLTNFYKLPPPTRVLGSKYLRIRILRPQISLKTSNLLTIFTVIVAKVIQMFALVLSTSWPKFRR